jgi:hypothetical protein
MQSDALMPFVRTPQNTSTKLIQNGVPFSPAEGFDAQHPGVASL